MNTQLLSHCQGLNRREEELDSGMPTVRCNLQVLCKQWITQQQSCGKSKESTEQQNKWEHWLYWKGWQLCKNTSRDKNVVSNNFKLTHIELTTLKLTIIIIIGLRFVCVCRVTDPRRRMLSSGCSQVWLKLHKCYATSQVHDNLTNAHLPRTNTYCFIRLTLFYQPWVFPNSLKVSIHAFWCVHCAIRMHP